jgi:hypothetical protein
LRSGLRPRWVGDGLRILQTPCNEVSRGCALIQKAQSILEISLGLGSQPQQSTIKIRESPNVQQSSSEVARSVLHLLVLFHRTNATAVETEVRMFVLHAQRSCLRCVWQEQITTQESNLSNESAPSALSTLLAKLAAIVNSQQQRQCGTLSSVSFWNESQRIRLPRMSIRNCISRISSGSVP